MHQLDYDLKVLDEKIDGNFDQYDGPDEKDDVTSIETESKESPMLNTHIQYGRFLSQIYGRRRCKKMHDMTREDLLGALTLHRISHKEAYTDMKTVFLALGGAIQ